MTSPLTIPDIEAAIDTIVEHRDAILRGKRPYNPGDIRKIEDDLRDLRRIWSGIGSDEAIKEAKAVCEKSERIVDFSEVRGSKAKHFPDWLREHEKMNP